MSRSSNHVSAIANAVASSVRAFLSNHLTVLPYRHGVIDAISTEHALLAICDPHHRDVCAICHFTLMGSVDREADKTMAGTKAKGASGSFGVENELTVETQ